MRGFVASVVSLGDQLVGAPIFNGFQGEGFKGRHGLTGGTAGRNLGMINLVQARHANKEVRFTFWTFDGPKCLSFRHRFGSNLESVRQLVGESRNGLSLKLEQA